MGGCPVVDFRGSLGARAGSVGAFVVGKQSVGVVHIVVEIGFAEAESPFYAV